MFVYVAIHDVCTKLYLFGKSRSHVLKEALIILQDVHYQNR